MQELTSKENYMETSRGTLEKWEKDWPDVRYSTILGSNLVHFTNSKGKRLKGKSRLFTILITESAHMIWKLRCERVIKFDNAEEKFHSDKEIHNHWIATINKHLKFDKLLTNTLKYGGSGHSGNGSDQADASREDGMAKASYKHA
jgi:hypothetical protein